MASPRRFAYFLPVVMFLALRALSYAHPAPLPWTSGVFDSGGLDDVLQTVRIAYTGSGHVSHLGRETLATPTGRIWVSEPSLVCGAFLATVHPRAPPTS
ncbi:MAG TPA: hypothetical protein VIE44_11920 [Methylomirabilota bacterium]